MNYLKDHINVDLIEVISTYLPIKDVYNIVNTFDQDNHYNILNKIIIGRILSRLRSKFTSEDYNNVINFMKKTNCCISGSFILQCILDTDYKSDIDFFVSSKYIKEVKEILKLLRIDDNIDCERMQYEGVRLFRPHFEVMTTYYQKNESVISKNIMDELVEVHSDKYYEDYENLEESIKIELQFVILDVEDPTYHIINNFDLDIISNYLTYKNGKLELYIENIQNIINNIMKVKLSSTDERLKTERINRYQNRGFRFNDIEDLAYIQRMMREYNIYICDDHHSFKEIRTSKEKTRIKGMPVQCNQNCYINRYFNKYKHIHVIRSVNLNKKVARGFTGNYSIDSITYICDTDVIVYTNE